MEDPFLPQQIQSGFEKASDAFRNEKVKVRVLALLINNGMLNREDFEQAAKRAKMLREAQEKEKLRNAEEGKRLQAIRNKPDSMIPRLWRSKDTQPNTLLEYLATYDLEALENYLSDLRQRPLHYASLYTDSMINVIRLIENELAKRLDPDQRKLRELKKARLELAETKEATLRTHQKLKEVQAETKKLEKKLPAEKSRIEYSR